MITAEAGQPPPTILYKSVTNNLPTCVGGLMETTAKL